MLEERYCRVYSAPGIVVDTVGKALSTFHSDRPTNGYQTNQYILCQVIMNAMETKKREKEWRVL